MRTRTLLSTAALVALMALHGGCTSRPQKWRPIPGANVAPWEQTQAVCDPVLDSAQADVGSGGKEAASARAKAQYRSCMAKHGWTDQPVSREGQEMQRERDDALRQEAEQLKKDIRSARTKNALTLFVGVAPDCQAGDPGTEICSWEWKWQSKSQGTTVPIRMTCVLPKNGKPRDEQSCRVDPGH
jgi:hypothetical protein